MICTAEINIAEDSVLGDFINHVTYSWQRESVEEHKPINGLRVVDSQLLLWLSSLVTTTCGAHGECPL